MTNPWLQRNITPIRRLALAWLAFFFFCFAAWWAGAPREAFIAGFAVFAGAAFWIVRN